MSGSCDTFQCLLGVLQSIDSQGHFALTIGNGGERFLSKETHVKGIAKKDKDYILVASNDIYRSNGSILSNFK